MSLCLVSCLCICPRVWCMVVLISSLEIYYKIVCIGNDFVSSHLSVPGAGYHSFDIIIHSCFMSLWTILLDHIENRFIVKYVFYYK